MEGNEFKDLFIPPQYSLFVASGSFQATRIGMPFDANIAYGLDIRDCGERRIDIQSAVEQIFAVRPDGCNEKMRSGFVYLCMF